MCLESVIQLCSAVLVLDSCRLWFLPETIFFLIWRLAFFKKQNNGRYKSKLIQWSNPYMEMSFMDKKKSLNKLHILELARSSFLSPFQESVCFEAFYLFCFVFIPAPIKKNPNQHKLTFLYFHKIEYIWSVHLQINKNKQLKPRVFTQFFHEKWHRDFEFSLRLFLS